jgi:hypothetical protein
MNFQICLAIIYFNIGIYAWRPFYRGFEQKTHLNLAKVNIEQTDNNNTNDSNNLTNHTFMDEEEFMKILRFYRPI